MEQLQTATTSSSPEAATAHVKKTWEEHFELSVEVIPRLVELGHRRGAVGALTHVLRRDVGLAVIPTAAELDVHPSNAMLLMRDFSARVGRGETTATDALRNFRIACGFEKPPTPVVVKEPESLTIAGELTAQDIVAAVELVAGLNPGGSRDPSRDPLVVTVRKVAQFLMHRRLPLPKSQFGWIGRFFAKHHTTVLYGCSVVEEKLRERKEDDDTYILLKKSCTRLGIAIESL
jgi:hypothetical protein